MGRLYHLSKKMTEAEEKEVLREIGGLEDIKEVKILELEKKKYIMVKTVDNKYQTVMPKVENICRRVARSCELSFAKFVYED